MQDSLIRRLEPSDAALYRALMLEAYGTSPEAFTSSVAEREGLPLQWWAARMSEAPAATERVYGAFIGAELAGAAGLVCEQRERTNHKATLVGMYVRPAARGNGVARRLVQEVLRHAKALPRIKVVQLTVSEQNAAAVALYRLCGFESFGTEPMAVQFGSGFVAKVHMWCRIDENGP